MYDLLGGRDLMAVAEKSIRDCLANVSPGEGASAILRQYQYLRSPSERNAWIAVLATQSAINQFIRDGASISKV
jgi:hypothetical protein